MKYTVNLLYWSNNDKNVFYMTENDFKLFKIRDSHWGYIPLQAFSTIADVAIRALGIYIDAMRAEQLHHSFMPLLDCP